jgi:hypothetical protein
MTGGETADSPAAAAAVRVAVAVEECAAAEGADVDERGRVERGAERAVERDHVATPARDAAVVARAGAVEDGDRAACARPCGSAPSVLLAGEDIASSH